MSGSKYNIPKILIQKFLCQVLVLLTLLEFIYRFTSKNRIQPKLEKFSGAATCCCGFYGGTNLCSAGSQSTCSLYSIKKLFVQLLSG